MCVAFADGSRGIRGSSSFVHVGVVEIGFLILIGGFCGNIFGRFRRGNCRLFACGGLTRNIVIQIIEVAVADLTFVLGLGLGQWWRLWLLFPLPFRLGPRRFLPFLLVLFFLLRGPKPKPEPRLWSWP